MRSITTSETQDGIYVIDGEAIIKVSDAEIRNTIDAVAHSGMITDETKSILIPESEIQQVISAFLHRLGVSGAE